MAKKYGIKATPTIVDGRIDKGWMQRTITREPAAGVSAKATREPRLSLVY